MDIVKDMEGLVTSAAEAQTGLLLLQDLCGREVVTKKVEPRACIACEVLKKEFTKWGHLSPYTGNTEFLGFQDAAQARQASSESQQMTCLSCSKGQISDHISNPTYSGTVNQSFRNCKSDFDFPKFPKHALAYCFFFCMSTQIISIFN